MKLRQWYKQAATTRPPMTLLQCFRFMPKINSFILVGLLLAMWEQSWFLVGLDALFIFLINVLVPLLLPNQHGKWQEHQSPSRRRPGDSGATGALAGAPKQPLPPSKFPGKARAFPENRPQD